MLSHHCLLCKVLVSCFNKVTCIAVLLSRQFANFTRIRIEGLLAAFPKLIVGEKQHTYVEAENVRYVYQPLESLYVLLVTNKQSNIVEDLETVRLLSKIVSTIKCAYIYIYYIFIYGIQA